LSFCLFLAISLPAGSLENVVHPSTKLRTNGRKYENVRIFRSC
jgi:hypothetical protein